MSIDQGNQQFNYAQLEYIWGAAGGDCTNAAMAAAIAMAESGGNSAAYDNDSNGTTDRGLWQINSSNGAGSTYDIMTNARTAVSMSNNGKNWQPWCTAWSDGKCGSTKGATYLGKGAPFWQYLDPNATPQPVPVNGTNAQANQQGQSGSGTTQQSQQNQQAIWQADQLQGISWMCILISPLDCASGGQGFLNPMTIINVAMMSFLNPLIEIVAGILGVTAGGILIIVGLYMTISQTQAGQSAKKLGQSAVGIGAMAAGQPELAVGATRGVGAVASGRMSQQRFTQRSGIIGQRQQDYQQAVGARQVGTQQAMGERVQTQEAARTAGHTERLSATTKEQLRREAELYAQRNARRNQPQGGR